MGPLDCNEESEVLDEFPSQIISCTLFLENNFVVTRLCRRTFDSDEGGTKNETCDEGSGEISVIVVTCDIID